jgi:preprotein translocase SecE subunit
MARDRQRSKARQRARAAGQQPRGKRSRSRDDVPEQIEDTTPDELEGATPYVDEAHMAEAGADVPAPNEPVGETPSPSTERDPDFDFGDHLDRADDAVEVPADLVVDGGSRGGGGGPLDVAEGAQPGEHRERGRLVTFLRACVDELRRVQWPDRKHVFQATAVVLGFVLIAGSWLGLMDAIWQPLIQAIL